MTLNRCVQMNCVACGIRAGKPRRKRQFGRDAGSHARIEPGICLIQHNSNGQSVSAVIPTNDTLLNN
ncbi:protein of unknown function [Pararobbsia alpina]